MATSVNPNMSLVRRAFSLMHARAGFGMGGQKNIVMLQQLMARDYYHVRDEFIGTLDAVRWSTATLGAGGAAPVFSAAAGGQVQFVTGGANPGVSTLFGPNAIYNSDDNPGFHWRFQNPAAVTNYVFEFGLVNVYTTKTTPAVSALGAQSAAGVTVATIGNGVTDGALLVMNTGLTLTTPALVGVGTSTAVLGQAINLVNGASPTVWTPTVSKWIDVYMGVRVGSCWCEIYENDGLVGRFDVASGPDTAKLLFPVFLVKDLGTSKVANADTFMALAERNGR